MPVCWAEGLGFMRTFCNFRRWANNSDWFSVYHRSLSAESVRRNFAAHVGHRSSREIGWLRASWGTCVSIASRSSFDSSFVTFQQKFRNSNFSVKWSAARDEDIPILRHHPGSPSPFHCLRASKLTLTVITLFHRKQQTLSGSSLKHDTFPTHWISLDPSFAASSSH